MSEMDAIREMGFSDAQGKQALLLTGNDLEAAIDMLLTNPPPVDELQGSSWSSGSQQAPTASEGALAQLVAMDFDEGRARAALEMHCGNLEAAVDTLLREQAEVAAVPAPAIPMAPATPVAPAAPSERKRAAGLADAAEGRAKWRRRLRPVSASDLSGLADAKNEDATQGERAEAIAMPTAVGDPLSLDAFASRLQFASAAFGPLRRKPVKVHEDADLHAKIAEMTRASVPGVEKWRGERGQKRVLDMLSDCYMQGLWMLGPPSAPANKEVVPAFRHIFAAIRPLAVEDPKRVRILRTLAEACQDCQQVQAREILRIFGDLTAQNETFESQLKYSLLRQKEAALNRFISKHHKGCDLDHTQVQPHQQRPHLLSGYIDCVAEAFGLDGLAAAQSDRFLPQVKMEIKKILRKGYQKQLLPALQKDLCVREWLQTLLADINNQVETSDRLIDRGCIFKWVEANMTSGDAHRVFYDEERANEFKGQDPEEPTEENQYQPFLSCKVLVEMLVTARFLAHKSPDSLGVSAGASCAVTSST